MCPMYNADILPDVTGRRIGAADKQWDGFFRNIVLTGTLSGSGLTTSDVTNSQVDVDSVNVQSDTGAGLLVRMRISNPSSGPVVFSFKNGLMQMGGINVADSPAVPIQIFSEPTNVASLLSIYQRGSNVNLALNVDQFGRITSYSPGYTTFAFQVARPAEANALFVIGPDGFPRWGAGANNALDVALTRLAAASMGLTNNDAGWANLSLGVLQSNVATGTPPLVVASSTLVVNLNADHLDGADWASPPTIGATTPGDGHFGLLSASAQMQALVNDGSTPPFLVLSAIPVDVLRVKFASDLTIEGHLLADGSGFKHKRVAIPSLAAGAEANIVMTWTTPFADSVYTPVVSVFDPGAAGGIQAGIRVKRVTQQDATHIAVQVINDDSVAHAAGILLAHAIRG